MGARSSGRSPGRSLLAVALVASAAFLLVAVAANRGGREVEVSDRRSGAGGFTLVAESDVPILQDLNRPEGRGALGMGAAAPAGAARRPPAEPPGSGSGAGVAPKSGPAESPDALAGVTVLPFRLLPGDDASCLNLYRPQRPRVLGVAPEMIERGGFTFQAVAREVANPWTLLDEDLGPAAVPAVADANSAQWILKVGLGDELELEDEAGQRVRLRLMGLLARSLFQSELLISEAAFVRHFPSRAGYSFFLVEAPSERAAEVGQALESGLGRFGFDVTPTAERLAAYRAVEETYLSTFQALGGLGLVLGTLGLAVVLLRNVLERRGELAALRAFGFRRRRLAALVVAENAFLLAVGLAVGTASALVAVFPHLIESAASVPWLTLGGTLALVFAVGLAASLAAVRRALRAPLIPALREE
jgi:hypothetical protein